LGVNCTWLSAGAFGADFFYNEKPFSTPLPPLRPSQLMIQMYYQMKLRDGLFFQPTLTDIPTPGQRNSLPNALAITLQVIALF
jgi:carbohydrate-selective porin OprB